MEKIAEAQIIADLAQQAFSTHTIDGNEFVIIPQNSKVESLERFKSLPSRRKGCVEISDLKSFIKYVETYKTESTKIFFGKKNGVDCFTAIFDFYPDGKEGTAWKEDRAIYEVRSSLEWHSWFIKNNVKFDQESFAEFVEVNAAHFVEPSSASMLEIAQTLSIKTNVDFKSAVRNSNGNQSITYAEVSDTKAGQNSDIEVPQRILLALSPFYNGPKYEIAAFLRIRIFERKITFFYDLINPHLIVEDAVREMATDIETKTSIQVLRGAA